MGSVYMYVGQDLNFLIDYEYAKKIPQNLKTHNWNTGIKKLKHNYNSIEL